MDQNLVDRRLSSEESLNRIHMECLHDSSAQFEVFATQTGLSLVNMSYDSYTYLFYLIQLIESINESVDKYRPKNQEYGTDSAIESD